MSRKEKYALVTGGAKRVGAQISLALAQRNFNLLIHYCGSKEDALKLQEQIKAKEQVDCILIQADLSIESELLRFFSEIKRVLQKKEAKLDLLLNNASVFEDNSFLETDFALFEKTIGLNFKAPFFISQFYRQNFQNGQIVNILDTEVRKNKTHHFIYQLSKKALLEFTRMSALELAPNFRVNALCPGLILPNAQESLGLVQKRVRNSPLSQELNSSHLIQALDYLLDHQFVTGETLFIDNGEHLL